MEGGEGKKGVEGGGRIQKEGEVREEGREGGREEAVLMMTLLSAIQLT